MKSQKKLKKHLGFGSLRHGLSELFRNLPDHRQKSKTNYSVHDAMMSGFACMYFQDPSLLQFQQQLKERENRDNLQTLFHVTDIPENSQMRDIIDETNNDQFRPIFKDYLSRIQRGKHLQQFQLFPGLYLCSIDATQYSYSENIHCPSCLTTNHKNGKTAYSHKVLQPAIMHPDMRQVIPLMPEEIRNTDGSIKQDCEVNAAKRLIPKIREDHPQLGLIIVGDGLFSHQPFILTVLSAHMHYIFAAKPDDHTFMMEWIDAYDPEDINTMRMEDDKGRIHFYKWINDVPLNGNKDSIKVNFFLLTMLAFYFHQIFELTAYLYQACRKKFGSKRHMWETLRTYIKIIVFDSWEHLLDFALTPTKYNVSCQPP